MATDIIQVDYRALEKIATLFANEQKRIQSLLQNLHQHNNKLRRGGWIAEASDVFYRDMDNRVFPSLDKLLYALGQSEITMREIARLMHLAEDDACGVVRAEKSTKGTIDKGEFGAAWLSQGDDADTGIRFKDFPYHLIAGTRLDYYEGYRLGNWTDEEIAKFFNEDQLRPKLSDYVDAKMVLMKDRAAGGVAAWEGSLSGDWGNASLKALSVEAGAGYEASLGKDGLKLKADAEAGVYLAHGTVSANVAGAEVTGEAFVGANIHGEAAATFNPITGEVGLKAGGEAFVGGRIGGQIAIPMDGVGIESTKVGVQGAVSYGVGVKANLDIGMVEPGKFKIDFQAGAAIGLGAEGGFTVEVDANKVADDVTRIGQAVTDFANFLF